MSEYNEVVEVGSWTVRLGRVVSDAGVTEVTVISDGNNEIATIANPAELMIALATYLGVKRFDADA